MTYSKLKEKLLVVGEALLIAGITVVAVMPVSCKITEQGIKIVGGDYVPPVLNNFVVSDEKTVVLEFSENVEVSGFVVAKVVDDLFSSQEHSDTLDLSPALERASGVYGTVACSVIYEDEEGQPVSSGRIIRFVLDEQMEIGQGYELYTKVRDSTGNTLTLAVPFSGYNSCVPEIMITEIQTESVSSQNKAEKTAGTYRNEYVELLVLKSGNLAGLELCSGYDGETKKYLFPTVEVTAGEIIVVHMRARGNGCISEEGDDLSLATSSYTSPQIRDLWTELETTTLGNKTDIIILRNRADHRLLDAVMFRASTVEAWNKTMIDYSQALDGAGIYSSGDIEEAFITDSLTATKTLHRTNAAEYRDAVLAEGPLEFPIPSSCDFWAVADPTPGEV